MQVNEKALLDSAEKILNKRRFHEEKAQGKLQKPSETSLRKGEKGLTLQKSPPLNTKLNTARILKLEAELKSLQENYSREQVRESFLLNKTKEIHEKLKYKGSPLFPEYKPGMDTKHLTKEVSYKLKKLVHSLKSVQVEMENLYALNFKKIHSKEANIKELDFSLLVKKLDPQRVAHLTKS